MENCNARINWLTQSLCPIRQKLGNFVQQIQMCRSDAKRASFLSSGWSLYGYLPNRQVTPPPSLGLVHNLFSLSLAQVHVLAAVLHSTFLSMPKVVFIGTVCAPTDDGGGERESSRRSFRKHQFSVARDIKTLHQNSDSSFNVIVSIVSDGQQVKQFNQIWRRKKVEKGEIWNLSFASKNANCDQLCMWSWGFRFVNSLAAATALSASLLHCLLACHRLHGQTINTLTYTAVTCGQGTHFSHSHIQHLRVVAFLAIFHKTK